MLFSILEFVGWAVVALGVVIAINALLTGGPLFSGTGAIFGNSSGKPSASLRLIASLPGLAMVLVGLLSVAFTQVARATVDMAEMARDQQLSANNQAGKNTLDQMEPATIGHPNTEPFVPRDNVETEVYKDITIVKTDGTYRAYGKTFSKIADARILIDGLDAKK